MKKKKFWIFSRKKKNAYNLHSKEEIYEILNYECNRTDRNKQNFSLIVFSFNKNNKNKKTLNKFIKVLLKRKRFIDEIGWLNDDSIGIVLPETDSNNAKNITAGIKENIYTKKLDPSVTFYSYPDNWFVKKNFNSRNNQYYKNL